MKKTLKYKIELLNKRIQTDIKKIKEEPKEIIKHTILIDKIENIFKQSHDLVIKSNYEIAEFEFLEDNKVLVSIFYY